MMYTLIVAAMPSPGIDPDPVHRCYRQYHRCSVWMALLVIAIGILALIIFPACYYQVTRSNDNSTHIVDNSTEAEKWQRLLKAEQKPFLVPRDWYEFDDYWEQVVEQARVAMEDEEDEEEDEEEGMEEERGNGTARPEDIGKSRKKRRLEAGVRIRVIMPTTTVMPVITVKPEVKEDRQNNSNPSQEDKREDPALTDHHPHWIDADMNAGQNLQSLSEELARAVQDSVGRIYRRRWDDFTQQEELIEYESVQTEEELAEGSRGTRVARSAVASMQLPVVQGTLDRPVGASEIVNLTKLSDEIFEEIQPKALALTTEYAPPVSHTFEAYDCTDPELVTTMVMTSEERCDDVNESPAMKVVTSYKVLQEADFQRVPGFRCKVLETVVYFYCGAFDHQTYVQESYYMKPVIISEQQCRELMHTKVFRPRGSDESQELIEGLNILRWQNVGKTVFTATDVGCYGGTVKLAGHERRSIEGHKQWHLYLLREELKVDSAGYVILDSADMKTNCQVDEESSCATSEGRVIWERPTNHEGCSLYHSRTTTGTEVQSSTLKMFMSSAEDGAMVRLQVRTPIRRCGSEVFPTNYPRLFLTKDSSNPAFDRPIHPEEASVSMYSNQQDGYIAGIVMARTAQAFRDFGQELCKQRYAETQFDIVRKAAAAQAASTAVTVHLGDGQFATATGDTWSKYTCRKLMVTGLSEPICYSALPVRLASYDSYKYRSDRGRENDTFTFFIEPVSHRLTTVANEEPCVPMMPALYKNIRDQYIAVTPGLRLARAPDKRPSNFSSATLALTTLNVTDMVLGLPEGGIYNSETRRKFDHFLQSPQRQISFATMFASQMDGRRFENVRAGPLTVTEVFPGEGIVTYNPFSWIGNIYEFLTDLGDYVLLIATVYILFKITCCVIGIIARILGLRKRKKKPTGFQYAGAATLPSLSQYFLVDELPWKPPFGILRRGERDAVDDPERGPLLRHRPGIVHFERHVEPPNFHEPPQDSFELREFNKIMASLRNNIQEINRDRLSRQMEMRSHRPESLTRTHSTFSVGNLYPTVNTTETTGISPSKTNVDPETDIDKKTDGT